MPEEILTIFAARYICSCFCWYCAWPGLGCNNLLLSNELINHQETQSTRTKLTEKFDQNHLPNFKYLLLPVLEPIIDGHIQKCWSFTPAIIQMPSFKLNTPARLGRRRTNQGQARQINVNRILDPLPPLLSLLLLLLSLTKQQNLNLASTWTGLKSKAIKREVCTLKKTFNFANIDIIRQVWSKYLIERKTMEEGGVELSQENY